MAIMGFFEKKITAIIVFPSKRIIMHKCPADSTRFTIGKGQNARTYQVDAGSIYYFNDAPLLFYHSETASPVVFVDDQTGFSMSSKEFQAVMESKVVKDLITASGGVEWDITMIAAIIAALAGIVAVVQGGGFGFLGG